MYPLVFTMIDYWNLTHNFNHFKPNSLFPSITCLPMAITTTPMWVPLSWDMGQSRFRRPYPYKHSHGQNGQFYETYIKSFLQTLPMTSSIFINYYQKKKTEERITPKSNNQKPAKNNQKSKMSTALPLTIKVHYHSLISGKNMNARYSEQQLSRPN